MVLGFKKRKQSDVIDFVELQKRGLMDAIRRQRSEARIPVSSDGVVDFTSSSSSSSSSGAGSFLGFMDSSSSGTSEKSAVDFWGNPIGSASKSTNNNEDLRVKIDDLEYKLDRLMERIEKLEESGS